MRRREFIGLLGGTAAAWPWAAGAQQQLATPVIGYLSSGNSTAGRERQLDGLRKGLAQTGFIEGQNSTFIFRWAGDDYGQLAPMAADLVRRQAAVIVCPQRWLRRVQRQQSRSCSSSATIP
jgi:putative ABC transport system substrate-binding protein